MVLWTVETDIAFDELVAGLRAEDQETVRSMAEDVANCFDGVVDSEDIAGAVEWVTREGGDR